MSCLLFSALLESSTHKKLSSFLFKTKKTSPSSTKHINMAKSYGKGKMAIESEEQHRLRFQVELEFVQCLANPNYLHFIAQRGYFKDSAFINYLKYLLYWKEPEYARYLKYPMCLYFLDLLQYEHFRREIVSAQCCKFIDDQAILLWQHYTRRRTKLYTMNNGVIQMEPGSSGNPNETPGGSNGQMKT